MSVKQAPNGKDWKVRWKENGHDRQRQFTRKGDAEKFDLEIKRRKQLGPLAVAALTDRGPTLGEYITEHWLPEHGVNLELATLERYASVYELHISPTFDKTPIREITVADIRAWQADCQQRGIGAPTITKARTYLSSVLRHAAESSVILANPITSTRPPRAAKRKPVKPLVPGVVETIRLFMLAPEPRTVAASTTAQRQRRGYVLPAPGTPVTNQRDATIVSLMGFAGLRPEEVRGLKFEDMKSNTLLVERAADNWGQEKSTKTGESRTVRLLPEVASDVRAYHTLLGNPPADRFVLDAGAGSAWTKSDWNKWVADRWRPACRSAGLTPAPRRYDLRHTFASLLIASGRQPATIAKQLGHSVNELFSTYTHLFDEYEDAEKLDLEAEVRAARLRAEARLEEIRGQRDF
jgi:integrase